MLLVYIYIYIYIYYDYVTDVLPTMQAFTGKYKRTNIVFDVHLLSSLKSETGSMREMGVIATKMLK